MERSEDGLLLFLCPEIGFKVLMCHNDALQELLFWRNVFSEKAR